EPGLIAENMDKTQGKNHKRIQVPLQAIVVRTYLLALVFNFVAESTANIVDCSVVVYDQYIAPKDM
ncbi:hypothetical protein HAX54_029291, partial [Datura stramonium]|nr:hypothetical protein [Datura stramonium]